MKIILSHDIDHMTVWEHYKDSILPKYFVRNNIELFKGVISTKEYFLRLGHFFNNKWQNIEELMDLHDTLGVKSTFFLGVNNGIGLTYNLKHVKKWANQIEKRGFEAGVHGISYLNLEAIKKEFDTFSKIINSTNFGIRMHYLRQNNSTFQNLSDAGYLYDCSKFAMENPYKIGKMWEFPLQIMDGYIIQQNKRYQVLKLDAAIRDTKKIIDEAHQKNLLFLNLLFHDRYYSNAHLTWKKWYLAILEFLLLNKFEFITYRQAVNELNKTL